MVVDTDNSNGSNFYPGVDSLLFPYAKLKIGNKQVHFRTLSVTQSYGEHHTFSIEVPYNILKRELFSDKTKEIFDLSGSAVLITFFNRSGAGNEYDFKGIITNAEAVSTEGIDGYLLIEGKSPTVLLDTEKHYAVYSGASLQSIFKQIEERHLNFIDYSPEIVVEIDNKIPLDIVIQYNETDWEFMQRLCYEFGVNMYFTGSQLFIGEVEEWEESRLKSGWNVSELRFGTRLIPNQYKFLGYDPEMDSEYKGETSDKPVYDNNYLNLAVENNEMLKMHRKSHLPFETPVGEARERAEREEWRGAGKSMYANGVSKSYWATIGRPVVILSGEGEIGKFKIIKSKHVIDVDGRYRNEFESVSASVKVIPVEKPESPSAISLRAIVTSTKDPKNQGRVQVKFPLLDGSSSKAWLRVMTLDAGLTEDNGVNRGFIFIPEEGTQVIVGFEMGNVNYPYVAGALFHGKNREGGQENNFVKTLRTISGHTLEFNDGKEGWGISLYDKNSNVLRINSKENKVEISAVEEIVLESKKITLNATEELNLIGKKISEHAKEHEIQTEGTYKADANVQKLTSNNYKQSSTGGSEIVSSGGMEIKGSTIKLDMGGGAESPKAPIEARDMVVSPAVASGLLASEMLPEDNKVEDAGANPKIVSIKLLDDEGNETKNLSDSTNVEVETVDMAGRTLKLVLTEEKTQDEIHVGDFFIPTNDYVVKTVIRKRGRSISEEGQE